MFRRKKHGKRTPQSRISSNNVLRSLRLEDLERRELLAGDVMVSLAAQVLTITGDGSANNVRITPGPSTGEYVITGLNNTTINGPSLVVDIFNTIEVNLGGGSDTFTIEGLGPTDKILIPGDVNIENEDGNNTNQLINVMLNGTLDVTKVAGTSESNLEILGSTIIGDVTLDAGAFDGDSKTLIADDSHLQGNLTVDNNVGEDIFVTYASRIDGDVDIENRDGDTRTVFGVEEDPIVGGSLTIVNGVGNDKVIIHDTVVWQDVSIDNGDGHTMTTVERSEFGKGANVGNTGDFEIDNGAGIDEFRWIDSDVRDDLEINNHGNADGAAPPAADKYGSTTEITNARVGNDFDFESDNGYDVLTFTNVELVDDVADIALWDGASEVTFVDSRLSEGLSVIGAAGNDILILQNTRVGGDVDVDLGDGRDEVHLLMATQLLGSTSLDDGGDAAIDLFVRQLGPPSEAVEIAFLDFESFEVDEFILE